MRSVSRGLFVGAIPLTVVSLALAQTAPAPAPAPAPTAPAPTPTPTPTPNIPAVGRTPTQTTTPTTPTLPPRPIFVSGRVVLHNGEDLPEHVSIERLCSTNSVRTEGYTDSKGYFSLQLGQNMMVVPDASTQFVFDSINPNGLATSAAASNSSSSSLNRDNPFFDCELRARLPGYRSSSVLLAGRRSMDSPDIGQIVLYPIGAIQGHAVSVTNALAPKNAKKAYENGLNAVKKNKPEDAEKEFRKAVELYPKYAEAWTELGRLLISRKQLAPAREALNQAVAADPHFVFPHEQLYILAFEEVKWQELADTTDHLLHLNPYDFIGAYYYNGVANFQLRHFDEAEKSLREALGMDFRNLIPKTRYVLGLVLAQQKNYVEAKEQLRAFAKMAPNDPIIPKVNSILFQLDQEPQAQAIPPALQ